MAIALDVQAQFDKLTAQLKAQAREIQLQRDETDRVAALLRASQATSRGESTEAPASPPKRRRGPNRNRSDRNGADGTRSRRDLLRLSGMAAGAAGLAAASGGLARPQEADAIYTITGGQSNNADHQTTLLAQNTFTTGEAVLKVDSNNGGGGGQTGTTDLDGLVGIGGNSGNGVKGEGAATGNGNGVLGIGGLPNGAGVSAQGMGTGAGVSATGGATGTGVAGTGGGSDQAGVVGTGGTNGPGVVAIGGGTTGPGLLAFGTASGVPLALVASGSAGPPTGANGAGAIWVDVNGVFWVCIANGNPGLWATLQTGGSNSAGQGSFFRSAITTQPTLVSSNGTTWTDMNGGPTLSIMPTFSCTALLSANADLWTNTAGYNQDLGITVGGGVYPTTGGQPEAWKESGGFAGTFSPNAAFVQTAVPLLANTAYTVKLQWKTNKNAPGATIFAGAGPIGGKFSPTSLAAQLIVTG